MSVADDFQLLIKNVSRDVFAGSSNSEIAYKYGTSIEFARRQRRFLKPSPPIQPQQLKRGIFSMAYKKRADTENIKAVKAWVAENPDGYLKQPYTKIAEEIGLPDQILFYNLPRIIAERDGITLEEVSARRKAAGLIVRNKKTPAEKSETSAREGFQAEGNDFSANAQQRGTPDADQDTYDEDHVSVDLQAGTQGNVQIRIPIDIDKATQTKLQYLAVLAVEMVTLLVGGDE